MSTTYTKLLAAVLAILAARASMAELSLIKPFNPGRRTPWWGRLEGFIVMGMAMTV
jgi:hypothetical protein